MKSIVNFSKCSNINKIINILKPKYKFDKSMIFLNIVETNQ